MGRRSNRFFISLSFRWADSTSFWRSSCGHRSLRLAVCFYFLWSRHGNARSIYNPRDQARPFTKTRRSQLQELCAQRATKQACGIGNFYIVGFPGELTTMAGRRLRNSLRQFKDGEEIKWIALFCYANGYIQYATTPDPCSEGRELHVIGQSNFLPFEGIPWFGGEQFMSIIRQD
ncbi:MAG: hypothetical protein ACJAXU_001051 [Paracoccaceae bacterium]